MQVIFWVGGSMHKNRILSYVDKNSKLFMCVLGTVGIENGIDLELGNGATILS